jgi:hypothetical protein
VNAFFQGKQEKEYAWFSAGAVLPVLSISAKRAARVTVQAVKSRSAEVTLGAPADLLARFHGLFPALTAELMGWINQFLLPETGANGNSLVRGANLQERTGPLIRNMLWVLGRFAERPGTIPP